MALFQRTTVVPEPEESGQSGVSDQPEGPGQTEETSDQEAPSLQFNWEFLLPETSSSPESNAPDSPSTPSTPSAPFNWMSVVAPLSLLALAGIGISAAVYGKRRKETGKDEDSQ